MGFGSNSYATIWSVENKGKFTSVNLSTSRKNKETGQYDTDFSDYVAFVGDAHKTATNLKRGDRIRIGNCEATTNFDKARNIKYHNYTVFSFEQVDSKRDDSSTWQYKTISQYNGDDPF